MKIKTTRVASAVIAMTGVSQWVSAPAYGAEEESERIEIVGSRIKRTQVEGPSPITVLDRDAIDRTGLNNLHQILERLPVVGTGTFSTRGNSQDSTANGASGASLRGLGVDATLVLINGRRVAISSFAEGVVNNFVDLNSIPSSAIERVEILKDGASALYGSDAVAGVINIVLRKDFEGTEISVGYGNTSESDADEKTMSVLWGYQGQDASATLILDYFSNSALMNKDRGRIGTANQSPYGGMDFRSSRGFPGRFDVNDETRIDPGCPAGNAFGQTCVYDYGPWSILTPRAERVGAILQMERAVTSEINLFAEISAQHNTSEAGGAPTPLDEDAGLTVPTSHPNNPYTDVVGDTFNVGRYRTVDAGARRWDIESDSMRIITGLRGVTNEWDWEVALQKGRSESTQTGSRSQGWVRTDLLQQEIDAGRYNPFGGTFNDPSVIDAITTSLVRMGESHLTAADARISGEVFEIDGRMAGMAAGIEYREEDTTDRPDDQFQRGLIFGTESVSAAAERDHWSAFVEFALPVLDNLEVQVAARYDDYSDFGTSTTPKLAVRWSPIDTLVIRASWGEGFRAPSLAQIGLGPSEESQFFVDTYRCPTQDDSNPACASTDYTILFSGNPDLEAEESESWNVGAVWEPLDNLTVGIDIWSIEQENKIDEVPFGDVYTANCHDQNSTICVRNAPLPGQTLGSLSRINNTYFNVSSQETSGFDITSKYRVNLEELGEVSLSFDLTVLENFEKDGRDFTGEYEYPEYRWLGSADWIYGDWGVTGIVNFIGEFEDTPDVDFDGNLDFDQVSTPKVDSMLTLDVQVRYLGVDDTTFTFGIVNVLDEEPPFAAGDADDDLFGYASRVHNPRGRFIYGDVTYRF